MDDTLAERLEFLMQQAKRAGNSCTPADALRICRTWPGPGHLTCSDDEAAEILSEYETLAAARQEMPRWHGTLTRLAGR
jgi:hypothetical protein